MGPPHSILRTAAVTGITQRGLVVDGGWLTVPLGFVAARWRQLRVALQNGGSRKGICGSDAPQQPLGFPVKKVFPVLPEVPRYFGVLHCWGDHQNLIYLHRLRRPNASA